MLAVILVDQTLIRPFQFFHVYHSKQVMYKQTPEIFSCRKNHSKHQWFLRQGFVCLI